MSAGVLCPLCGLSTITPLARSSGRDYWQCGACELAFLEPSQRPGLAAERAHYGTHENDPSDGRYRAFLQAALDPLIPLLRPGAEGLDYGCGPGPTISVMMRELGFAMEDYDPAFRPDARVLARQYDFVTCTEAVEHFHSPAKEFARLAGLLRPGGRLVVMTQMWQGEREEFAEWWYVRDPTHVCFYTEETMAWIGRRHRWGLARPGRNVVIFSRT